jgi:predicted DCC family thiol-disulfide oxidoreductase YuxK
MAGPGERLFYDGECGMCHGAVRFILAVDRTGRLFRFTPLDSDLFRATVREAERTRLGETLVVQTATGQILARSQAVLHIMRRLRGIWRLFAGIIGLMPATLLDRLYDVVAWSRHRLFRRPSEVCPVMPPHLRQRFDF